MKTAADTLIQELKEQTQQIILLASQMRNLDYETLNWRPKEGAWSVLECLEHLNLYGDYYLPAMSDAIKRAPSKPDPIFTSGLLGDYFAKSMLPKPKMTKMKTFRDKNPIGSRLTKDTIERFIAQQQTLLDLLQLAEHKSLTQIRIKTSISPLIRLKLGDTFRFLINHTLRHLNQAQNVLSVQGLAELH